MQEYEGVFGVPHPQRGGKKTKWQEAGVEGKMAEVLEEHDVPAVKEEVDITLGDDGEDEIQNGRVIALDFDDVCCQSMAALCQEHNALWGTNMNVCVNLPRQVQDSFPVTKSRPTSTIRTQVGALLPVSPIIELMAVADRTEVEQKKKHLEFILPKTVAVPGFAAALRKLHALGHPLHIITARPEDCRAQVIGWLAEHGIGVGFGDNDIVAAVWFTHGFALPTAAEDPAGSAKDEKTKSDEALNAELQKMFKQSVGQGSSGKKKLKVSQLSEVQALTSRSYEQSTHPYSSTTTMETSNQF